MNTSTQTDYGSDIDLETDYGSDIDMETEYGDEDLLDGIVLEEVTTKVEQHKVPSKPLVTSRRLGFLDLPPELRNMIYAQVLPFETSLVAIPNRRKRTHAAALLETCQQVRLEAAPEFYRANKYSLSRYDFIAASITARLNHPYLFHHTTDFRIWWHIQHDGPIGDENLRYVRKLHKLISQFKRLITLRITLLLLDSSQSRAQRKACDMFSYDSIRLIRGPEHVSIEVAPQSSERDLKRLVVLEYLFVANLGLRNKTLANQRVSQDPDEVMKRVNESRGHTDDIWDLYKPCVRRPKPRMSTQEAMEKWLQEEEGREELLALEREYNAEHQADRDEEDARMLEIYPDWLD